MLTYFHCYLPETWEAQVRAGLINDASGVRFAQSALIDEKMKFNELAKRDGELYNILKESKRPFYIDRLQGGCYYEGYPYDMELVEDYKKMLGDNFWGFQMHEWMNNFLSDLNKLRFGNCPEWTKEAIEETIFKIFPFKNLFLECMTSSELADIGYPATLAIFMKEAEKMFKKRMDYTGGLLIPCDSICLSYAIELKNGVKRLMPEVGAQIPDLRIQLAYARGMAKSYNIPFGIYYEPWSADPCTACCYQRDEKNEWGISDKGDFPFHTEGENGGSSRSMQHRIHHYAYMAGAEFVSEEWGMCNTFYDWNDFELSPYGIVKRDFIRFTEKYQDIGKLITPIVLVVPKELSILEMDHLWEGGEPKHDIHLEYPALYKLGDDLKVVRHALYELFKKTSPMIGTEKRTLVNCVIPDAIDIVDEESFKGEEYSYIIDLSDSAEIKSKYQDKLIKLEDVAKILDEVLPCKVAGNAMKQFTRRDDGKIFVQLLNNSGVERTLEKGEILIEEAKETVEVITKNGQKLKMLEGNSKITLGDNGTYHIEIPAGGWFFGTLE